jgi:hypothetical protein
MFIQKKKENETKNFDKTIPIVDKTKEINGDNNREAKYKNKNLFAYIIKSIYHEVLEYDKEL